MIYDNLKSLQKSPSKYTGKIIENFDEGKIFSGGSHHPWRRFFARMAEVVIAGLVISFALAYFLSATIPRRPDQLLKIMEDPVISSFVVHLYLLPFEAAMLSICGTTPAKWLLGIRASNMYGKRLSLLVALNREFLIFVKGLFFGVPFVNLLPQIFAYFRLTRTGRTVWDKSTEAVVNHKKWGVIRAFFCTAAVIFSVILTSSIVAAGIY